MTWTQQWAPLLWWRLERTWSRRRGSTALPSSRSAEIPAGPHLTWIGHATFLMRLGSAQVLTDPIWSPRLFYAKRLTPPGIAIDRLGELHAVTISHNHFDHLDLATLVELNRLHRPCFIVPKNNGWLLRRSGIHDVVELDWWQSVTIRELEITLVPAQHWSQRGALDTNEALWGGFVYRSKDGTAYHAGDTAFEAEVFRRIGDRFAIDWAMLPIAAYDPEWFLSTQHINPEDGGKAFELLRAQRFVAMHYGTYELTDEPIGEPTERTRRWFEETGQADKLWLMEIGESRRL